MSGKNQFHDILLNSSLINVLLLQYQKYYKDVETALYAAGLLDFEILGFDAKIPVRGVNEAGAGDWNYVSLNVRA